MSTIDRVLPLTGTITPADEAAVAEAVRNAARDRTPLYPIGGGTSLDYGVRPTRPGLGLSLAGLSRVIDYPAEDMTITVEAGVAVADLARRLAAEGQRLPVDVRQPDRATVGGVVATGLSGPRRYACGTTRDYVIGVRAVDGRGTAFSGGGRVVKNAAGYNLCRLLVGSLGTLGVITQVTLMVRPMPEASTLLACDLPDFQSAEQMLARLVHAKALPTAIELQAGTARQDNPVLGPMGESSVARLFVGLEGSRPEVEWMVGQLGEQWRELGVTWPMNVSADEAARLWGWLIDSPADVQISVRPGATVALIQRLLELDPGCAIRAHAGDGVIGVRLAPLEPDQFLSLLRERLRPAVAEAEGKMVVHCCPDGVELTVRDVWGPPGDGATVMRAIKDRFDPEDVLNPGRFAYEE